MVNANAKSGKDSCVRDCSGILFLSRFLERDKKRYSEKPDTQPVSPGRAAGGEARPTI